VNLKPFSIIGFSYDGDVACLNCMSSSIPVTYEVTRHTCTARDHRAAQLEHGGADSRPILTLGIGAPETIVKALFKLGWQRVDARRFTHRQYSPPLPDKLYLNTDTASCPACQRNGRASVSDGPQPLYAADRSLHGELCTRCDRPILQVAHARLTEPATVHIEHTTEGRAKLPALQFDQRPPPHILSDLKAAGWSYLPVSKTWYWRRSLPPVYPASIPAPVTPNVVMARAPIVHKPPRQARSFT
jgi:hypothetical protein